MIPLPKYVEPKILRKSRYYTKLLLDYPEKKELALRKRLAKYGYFSHTLYYTRIHPKSRKPQRRAQSTYILFTGKVQKGYKTEILSQRAYRPKAFRLPGSQLP